MSGERHGHGTGTTFYVWIGLKRAEQHAQESPTMCRILEEFCSLLSDILWRFAKLQDPWKVRVSSCSQNGSPPPPKPLPQSLFLHQHIVNRHLSQLWRLQAQPAFLYRSHLHPLWVEYKHWLVKRAVVVDQKGFQWRTVRIYFRQT